MEDLQNSNRIEQKEATRCREMLRNIEKGTNTEPINQEFRKCFLFKNRLVTQCQVLHFAVMEAARLQNGRCVRQVLEAKADVFSKALYMTVKNDAAYETELNAMHIAAGLGSCEAMEALSHGTAESDLPRLVSSHATVNIKGSPDRFNFYCPIHDAAYLGQKDAVLWLLRHKAQADAQNKDGCTPLHFIALIGGRGSLMDSDVQEVVTELLEHKANLDARSFSAKSPYPCDPFLQQKIPLEIAAETQYPKDLMYLMAASYQSTRLDVPRAFADIRLLSNCNMKVAEVFAHDLVARAKNDQHMRDMIIKEAQMSGAVDRIAALLYMVPSAGAALLDMLTVPPIVQDAAKHPLPSRAALHTGPVRCTYQPDVVKRRQLTWPQWEYDADNQVYKEWHSAFVPPRVGGVRQDNVYDVDVKVVLLPNLLDVDIFMALTRTWETDNHVFAKLPIQGAIYCLWDKLVWPIFASSWLFMGVELAVLLRWGLQTSEAEKASNSLQNLHLYWSILLAGAVREGLNLLWWFLAHWSKWHSHDDATMKSLWHPTVFFTDAWFLSSCFTLSCRLLLVMPCVCDSFFSNPDPVMSEWEQGLLAINTFAQGFAVTYMLRLLHRFKRILAIFKTFFSRTILEMLLIAVMIFASFSFAFLTLIRREHAAWTVTYLYRGLMFGDGDGLDRMGLMLGGSDEDNKAALVLFMVCGTILFNVTILNLVIAIYGNEYEQVNAETELHFMKERAKYCLIYVEMLHKQRLLHIVQEIAEVSSMEQVPMFTKLVLLLTQSLLQILELQKKLISLLQPLRRYQIITAVLLVAIAALPWICSLLYRVLNALPITSAFLLSTAQIAWQAMLIQADWFQPDAPELAPGIAVAQTNGDLEGIVEGPAEGGKWTVKSRDGSFEASESQLQIKNASFLWICHRSDYDEAFFQRTEEVSRRDLEHVSHQLDETKQKLEDLERNLSVKLDVLMRLMGDGSQNSDP